MTTCSVRVSVEEASDIACRALVNLGAAADVARHVVATLVANELDGYSSHGLLRVPEYCDAIAAGTLDPQAKPRITTASPLGTVIDADRSFGIVALDTVAAALADGLRNTDVAVVALRDSGHVGRLAYLGRQVAAENAVLFGACNFNGAGQKVAPFGSKAPRLATNPLVFAFPVAGRPPVVIDMTTSTVSEGRVRTYLFGGRPVPEGWLADSDWKPVDDAACLYATPATAMLLPLGGLAAGHKGFGLGLMVEILSGVVAGSGLSTPEPSRGGNGGFFLAFRPSMLGRSFEQQSADFLRLAAHLASEPLPEPLGPVRIPGWKRASTSAELLLPQQTWQELLHLAQGAG